MSYYSELLDNIKHYVTELFQQSRADYLMYHNLCHTTFVVDKVQEIAAHYSLDELDFFIISAGAWFHDTGHLNGGLKYHEDRSILMMKDYLEAKEVDHLVIDKIENCICATKFPHKPKSLLEEILCDADTYNLGTKDFATTDTLLKQELEYRQVAIDSWVQKTLELLAKHKYFTPYCQALLKNGKQENIELMCNLLQKMQSQLQP